MFFGPSHVIGSNPLVKTVAQRAVHEHDVSGAGAEDPWEKVEWGRKLQHYPSVEEFVAFPGQHSKGLSHCILLMHSTQAQLCL